MNTNLFDTDKTRFLSPTSLAHELLILDEIGRNGFVLPAKSSLRSLGDTMVKAYLARLAEQKYVENQREGGESVVRLTAAGQDHFRYLMVDYVQELLSLYSKARDFFRKRLADHYLAGIRTVAIYPPGETAEVVYLAMQDSGLKLVGAVDDDPMRWGTQFHDVTITGPSKLAEVKPDGVLVTTCVYQNEIASRVNSLNVPNLKVLTL